MIRTGLPSAFAVVVTLTALAHPVVAAPEGDPPAARPISDAVVQGVWSRCAAARVVRERAGVFTVTGPDRVVAVSAEDSCRLYQPERGGLRATIEFGLEVSDPKTKEVLATITRSFEVESNSCEDARKRAAKDAEFVGANAHICVEGFHPLEPEPLDLLSLLQPTFSAAGPFVLGAEEGLGWRVNGRRLAIVGEASCGLSSRSLESPIIGQLMRSWAIRVRFDLKDPAAKTKLRAFNIQLTTLGISCAAAFDNNRPKVDKEVAKAFAEAQKVLPKPEPTP